MIVWHAVRQSHTLCCRCRLSKSWATRFQPYSGEHSTFPNFPLSSYYYHRHLHPALEMSSFIAGAVLSYGPSVWALPHGLPGYAKKLVLAHMRAHAAHMRAHAPAHMRARQHTCAHGSFAFRPETAARRSYASSTPPRRWCTSSGRLAQLLAYPHRG